MPLTNPSATGGPRACRSALGRHHPELVPGREESGRKAGGRRAVRQPVWIAVIVRLSDPGCSHVELNLGATSIDDPLRCVPAERDLESGLLGPVRVAEIYD
jgi:hypothetical protein